MTCELSPHGHEVETGRRGVLNSQNEGLRDWETLQKALGTGYQESPAEKEARETREASIKQRVAAAIRQRLQAMDSSRAA